MSYELVIFEKSKTPTDQPDFLNWYNKKMECDDEQDISSAPEKIQKAFHLYFLTCRRPPESRIVPTNWG